MATPRIVSDPCYRHGTSAELAHSRSTETVVARALPLAGAYGLDVKNSRRSWSFFLEAYCVTLVTAGHGRWRYGRREGTITPHSLMLMEPGEIHTTRVESTGDFHTLLLPAASLHDIFGGSSSFEPRLGLLGTSQPELVQGFSTACSMLEAGADEERQKEQFALSLTRLLDHATETGAQRQAVATTYVRKAARMLREMYEGAPWQTVHIASVSAELGMSYHWLVHSFTAEFGMAPYQYVQALRLAKLRGLLLEGPAAGLRSLADIAGAVGFADKSHLHRSVKRAYGTSPWQLALQLNPRWRRDASAPSCADTISAASFNARDSSAMMAI